MTLAYLLYSFPFFMLAVIILINIKKDSQFFFLKNLWLLAIFAGTHGTHELAEMFAGFTEPAGMQLNFADAITLAISFYCLLQFGIGCIFQCKRLSKWMNLIPVALAASWVAVLFFKQYNLMTGQYRGEGDIYARYILGMPACFLTSYAFILQLPGIENAGKPGLVRSAIFSAAGFAVFGLVSGLVVPPAGFFPASAINYAIFYQKTGVPVQIVRAAIAAFIAYNMLRLMGLFEWEASVAASKEEAKLRREIEESTYKLAMANSQISESLKERETLLRELYHRTKNNMQLISSLIVLQSKYVSDERSLQMLMDAQKRIQAMSMVHEKLYQSARLSDLNMREYIEDLAKALVASYHQEGHVTLKMDMDDILFNIDMAIPCGLIINELVTNSIKYAFPGGRPGEVSITLHRLEGEKVKLTFEDNGIGMQEGFDLKKADSLGLKLLNNLATKQLNGDVQLQCRDGCRFELVFDINTAV